MITIENKKDCCGCSACYSICPKSCITMSADEEGFKYPKINMVECINCGLCEKVCPIKNRTEEIPFEQKGYVVQHKDEKILKESTFGGAFTAIAQYVIEHGGVVFGAAFDDNFNVIHTYVENVEGLAKFRNSKYVQSDVKDTFKEAKKFLQNGRLVCYSGTPCQIEGLKSFLQRSYDNLITVDVVCRAVPSPLILKKYLEMQNEKIGSDIRYVKFRDKTKGYKYSALNIYDEDNVSLYHNGIDTDQYLRAFFSNICDRPSCYCCSFKKRYRVSDFTLWDCFEPDEVFPAVDNDRGATRVLVHSQKGKRIFEKINSKLFFGPVPVDNLVNNSKEMVCSIPMNPRRKEFFDDVNKISARRFFDKYFPITLTTQFEKYVRLASNKLGLYKYVRKIYKKLFGERKR